MSLAVRCWNRPPIDVDAGVEKARALGAEVLGGPFDIPEVGRMAVLKDPQGATPVAPVRSATVLDQVLVQAPGARPVKSDRRGSTR